MAKTKTKAAAKKSAPKKALSKKATSKKAGPKKKAVKSLKVSAAKPPADSFKSLADIRRTIDDLDDVLVPLMCRRHYVVTQAAQFKPSVKGVVVQSRVEAIVARVRRMAKTYGANPDTIEAVYRSMIDEYTKDEQRNWRKIHKP